MVSGGVGEIATLMVNIKGDASQLTSAIATATSSVGNLGKSMSALGGISTALITAPIVAIGAVAVESAIKLQDAYNIIQRGTGTLGPTLEALKTDFKNVASNVPEDFNKVATAMTDVYDKSKLLTNGLQLSGKALEDLTTKFLEWSRISGASVTDLINNTAEISSRWHMTSQQTSAAMDMMNTASQTTGINVTQLGDSISKIAIPATNLHLSFKDVTEQATLMTEAGLNANSMYMAMNKVLVDSAKAGEDPTKRWKEDITLLKQLAETGTTAGMSQEQLKQITTDFSARTLTQMIASLKESKTSLADLDKALDNSQNSIHNSAMATVTFSQQLDIFKNRLMIAFEPLGKEILSILTNFLTDAQPVLDWVTKAVEWFSKLPKPVQDAAIALAAIAAAVGPLLMVLGPLMTGLGVLGIGGGAAAAGGGIGLLAGLGPILVIAAGAAVALLIGYELYQNWKPFHDLVDDIATKLTKLVSNPAAFGQQQYKEQGITSFMSLQEAASGKGGIMDPHGMYGDFFTNAANTIKVAGQNFGQSVQTAVTNFNNSVKSGADTFSTGVRTAGEAFGTWVQNGVNTFNTGVSNAGAAFMGIINQVGGILLSGAQTAGNAIVSAANTAASVLNGVISAIGTAASNAANTISNTIQNSGVLSNLYASSTSTNNPISGSNTPLQNITNLWNSIPLQHGGIVTKPTLSLIGEAGPEAVLPLNWLDLLIEYNRKQFDTETEAEDWLKHIAELKGVSNDLLSKWLSQAQAFYSAQTAATTATATNTAAAASCGCGSSAGGTYSGAAGGTCAGGSCGSAGAATYSGGTSGGTCAGGTCGGGAGAATYSGGNVSPATVSSSPTTTTTTTTSPTSLTQGGAYSVTIYTATNCPYCEKEKAWLDSKGVKYTEIKDRGSPSGKGTPETVITDDKGNTIYQNTGYTSQIQSDIVTKVDDYLKNTPTTTPTTKTTTVPTATTPSVGGVCPPGGCPSTDTALNTTILKEGMKWTTTPVQTIPTTVDNQAIYNVIRGNPNWMPDTVTQYVDMWNALDGNPSAQKALYDNWPQSKGAYRFNLVESNVLMTQGKMGVTLGQTPASQDEMIRALIQNPGPAYTNAQVSGALAAGMTIPEYIATQNPVQKSLLWGSDESAKLTASTHTALTGTYKAALDSLGTEQKMNTTFKASMIATVTTADFLKQMNLHLDVWGNLLNENNQLIAKADETINAGIVAQRVQLANMQANIAAANAMAASLGVGAGVSTQPGAYSSSAQVQAYAGASTYLQSIGWSGGSTQPWATNPNNPTYAAANDIGYYDSNANFVAPSWYAYLQKGGIVKSPTMAILAESGPEAVVPLNKGGRGLGNVYNIHVEGIKMDEVADTILKKIRRMDQLRRF